MALILVIQNISDLAPISDYRYQVMVGDGTTARSKVLEVGEVKGHNRSDGWEVLVEKLLKQRLVPQHNDPFTDMIDGRPILVSDEIRKNYEESKKADLVQR